MLWCAELFRLRPPNRVLASSCLKLLLPSGPPCITFVALICEVDSPHRVAPLMLVRSASGEKPSSLTLNSISLLE